MNTSFHFFLLACKFVLFATVAARHQDYLAGSYLCPNFRIRLYSFLLFLVLESSP